MVNLSVCIIGAGASGLSSVKHAKDAGMDVTLFEQTKYVGGTWVYMDDVGKDQYGLNIHTSMYKGLKTNAPKEIMGYPDFPMPDDDENSYIPAEKVLNFLQAYAKHFELEENMKFEHHVMSVRPHGETQWEVVVRDLPNDKVNTYIFDGIMVCNGHYSTPVMPKFPGEDTYRGRVFHSHDFRSIEAFKNDNVLVIGSGPSGLDLVCEISKVADRISLSHHVKGSFKIKFPEKITLRPDIECITENGVRFKDGTTEEYNVIIYCTGYHYTFPFLTPECGITVEENYVRPLYKHIVNISHPTMALIGVPYYVCNIQMFDLQVRFFLKFLSGAKTLPSQEDMRADTEEEMKSRWARGYRKRQAHMMGPDQGKYYNDLATLAEIEPLKPVMTTLNEFGTQRVFDDFTNFRNDCYRIVDDYTFVKVN